MGMMVTIDKTQIILAPLRGLTNNFFRNAFANSVGGVDRAIAPYLVCNHADKDWPKELKKISLELSAQNNQLLTEAQLLGNDSTLLLERIADLKSIGIKQVNLNLGCPYPMVTNRKMGAALLSTPDSTIKLLSNLLDQSPLPLSIKLRLGHQDSRDIFSLIDILNDHRWSEITIHPRIATQLYQGKVDLDTFDQLVPRLTGNLCYNGDIIFKRDYQLLQQRYPTITTWMVGRGIIMNLFLPLEIRQKSPLIQLRKEMLSQFLETLEQSYLNAPNGHSHFLHRMNDLWQYVSWHFHSPEKCFKLIKKSKTVTEYHAAKLQIFQSPLITDGEQAEARHSSNLC